MEDGVIGEWRHNCVRGEGVCVCVRGGGGGGGGGGGVEGVWKTSVNGRVRRHEAT